MDHRSSLLRIVYLMAVTAPFGVGFAQAASEAPMGDSLRVTVAAGAVSVAAHDVRVIDVVLVIGRQAGLLVELVGALDERVTIELDQQPLDQALPQVLRGRSYVLRYDSGHPAAAPRLSNRLWVFDRQALGFVARPGIDSPPESKRVELERAVNSVDPAERLEAVSSLIADPGGDATSLLTAAALLDEDAAVREEAVYGVGAVGVFAAGGVLEQALLDPARRVREAAVLALADLGGDESIAALSIALADTEVSVREQAVYALGELGGEGAMAVVRQALGDEHDTVRRAAEEVLAARAEVR